jgi:hypothetical protein
MFVKTRQRERMPKQKYTTVWNAIEMLMFLDLAWFFFMCAPLGLFVLGFYSYLSATLIHDIFPIWIVRGIDWIETWMIKRHLL